MLHDITIESNTIVADLVALAIEHERIEAATATAETATIQRYIAGAIRATENYLDKDVFPHTHTFTDGVTFPFVFSRGLVREAKTKDSGGVDLATQPKLIGRRDMKSGRLEIGTATYSIGDTDKLVIKSGCANLAAVPDDVVAFLLTAFGTLYELRESANYSSMVFDVAAHPRYLLDSFMVVPLA